MNEEQLMSKIEENQIKHFCFVLIRKFNSKYIIIFFIKLPQTINYLFDVIKWLFTYYM